MAAVAGAVRAVQGAHAASTAKEKGSSTAAVFGHSSTSPAAPPTVVRSRGHLVPVAAQRGILDECMHALCCCWLLTSWVR